MLRYLLRRLLFFIPTFFAVSLISFFLSTLVPGDPVRMSMKGKELRGMAEPGFQASLPAYREQRRRMGLDHPLFYFSISDGTIPDTLHRIPDPQRREDVRRLAWKYGDWENVAAFLRKERAFKKAVRKSKKGTDPIIEVRRKARDLLKDPDPASLQSELHRIHRKLEEAAFPGESKVRFEELAGACSRMIRNRTTIPRYIPHFHWHGSANRYHHWFFGDRPWFGAPDEEKEYASGGFLRGDFGKSYYGGREVSKLIGGALKWTLFFSGVSVLLVYGLSLFLGVLMSVHHGGTFEKGMRALLLMLYSLPEFWVGTVLLALFANPDVMKLFPAAFTLMEYPEGAAWWERAFIFSQHMILPLLCYTYGSLAYVSRQMEGGMLRVLDSDFMRTSLAKGLPERQRIWKHALRNALFPIITLFGTVFPFLISGSVIIENIFSIPGMGKLAYDALLARDHPVIFTLIMFSALLTMLGTLLSDILYAWADPRIRYEKKRTG